VKAFWCFVTGCDKLSLNHSTVDGHPEIIYRSLSLTNCLSSILACLADLVPCVCINPKLIKLPFRDQTTWAWAKALIMDSCQHYPTKVVSMTQTGRKKIWTSQGNLWNMWKSVDRHIVWSSPGLAPRSHACKHAGTLRWIRKTIHHASVLDNSV